MVVNTQHFCNASFRCSEMQPSEREAQMGARYGSCVLLSWPRQHCSRMKLVWLSRAAFNGKSHKISFLLLWFPILLAYSEVVILTPLLSGIRWVGKGRHPVIKIGMCSSTWRNSISQELVPVDNSFIHLQQIWFLCLMYCEAEEGAHTLQKSVWFLLEDCVKDVQNRID